MILAADDRDVLRRKLAMLPDTKGSWAWLETRDPVLSQARRPVPNPQWAATDRGKTPPRPNKKTRKPPCRIFFRPGAARLAATLLPQAAVLRRVA